MAQSLLDKVDAEIVRKVIQYIEDHSQVYDKASRGYSNSNLKANIFKKLDTELKDTTDSSGMFFNFILFLICLGNPLKSKAIWEALVRKYKESKHKTPSGSGSDNVQVWPFADSMKFLDNHIETSNM